MFLFFKSFSAQMFLIDVDNNMISHDKKKSLRIGPNRGVKYFENCVPDILIFLNFVSDFLIFVIFFMIFWFFLWFFFIVYEIFLSTLPLGPNYHTF